MGSFAPNSWVRHVCRTASKLALFGAGSSIPGRTDSVVSRLESFTMRIMIPSVIDRKDVYCVVVANLSFSTSSDWGQHGPDNIESMGEPPPRGVAMFWTWREVRTEVGEAKNQTRTA